MCLSLGWGAPKKSPLRMVVASGLLLRVSLFLGGGGRMLRKDKEEAEAIKNAKALEEEKAMYSVRGAPASSALSCCKP